MSRSVAVVGAGLAGVTTAYELAALGFRVHVFERGGSVAEQASFASNALLAPFVPGLLDDHVSAPLAYRFKRWRASRQGGEAAGQLAMLSQLSLERTAKLRHDLGLDDEPSTGLLVALADARRTATAEARLENWHALGCAVQLISADEARRLEPGLNAEAPLAAALTIPSGGCGNARLFAQQLRHQAQRLGAEFRFHTTARAIVSEGAQFIVRHEYTPPIDAPTRGAEREAGDTQPHLPGPLDERFDAVVLCNGLGAAPLLGEHLPVAVRHEASVTAPRRLLEAHPDLGPKSGWIDPVLGVSIARIGLRVRVTGDLKVTSARTKHQGDHEALHRTLQQWFPGSVLHQQVQHGQSTRATVADGLPLLGATRRPGLWLNLSPGGHGWGLACGSAQILAQLMAGQVPATDISGLGLQRLA